MSLTPQNTYLSEHHKDQLLDVLLYIAGPEVRQRLMDEVPAAYNAYYGRDIVTVVRTSALQESR